jgi:hypothetical protein
MRKYLNRRTGVEIETPCVLEGPDWTEITCIKEEPKAEEKAPEKAAPKKRTAKKG